MGSSSADDSRVRRSPLLIVLSLLLALVSVPGSEGWAERSEAEASERHTRISASPVRAGVSHEVWQTQGSSAHTQVAVLEPGKGAILRVVSAQGGVAGGRESVSSMCRRTPHCIAAVNGDFFTGEGPVGGVIANGRMLRSPSPSHQQVSLRPLRASRNGLGEEGWSGAIRGGGQRLAITGVNVAPSGDGISLYTSAHGPTTPACSCRELALVGEASLLGRIGEGTQARLGGWSGGQSELSARRGVLVGAGAGAAALESFAQATGAGATESVIHLRAASQENLGAHPIVLSEGGALVQNRGDSLITHTHPRTGIGWDSRGRVVLAVADGRQPGGPGLSVSDMTSMLRRLGASSGVLLDGGGSSTFVLNGQVLNRPSDGAERLVANAVLIIEDPRAVAAREAAARAAAAKAAQIAAAKAAAEKLAAEKAAAARAAAEKAAAEKLAAEQAAARAAAEKLAAEKAAIEKAARDAALAQSLREIFERAESEEEARAENERAAAAAALARELERAEAARVAAARESERSSGALAWVRSESGANSVAGSLLALALLSHLVLLLRFRRGST